jgi:hypothetical protein
VLIRFKIGKDKYEIDEDDLTAGEAFLLHRDYGLADFGDLSYKDPQVLLGLITLAVRRKQPALSEDAVREQAETVKTAGIFEDLTKQFEKIIADAEAKEQDPPAPAGDAPAAGETSGSSETTPAKRGSRSGPKP